MDEKIRDEQHPEEKSDDYSEPSLLDIEDLDNVSGGAADICITGGSVSSSAD